MRNLHTYFSGEWRFVRTVTIASTGAPYASGSGTASFARTDEGALLLRERGAMQLESGGPQLSFFKEFTYRTAPAALDIYFADGPSNGSLYQQFLLEGNELLPRDTHHCLRDDYRGRFLLEEARFTYTVEISGPAKDMRIVTLCTRLAQFPIIVKRGLEQ